MVEVYVRGLDTSLQWDDATLGVTNEMLVVTSTLDGSSLAFLPIRSILGAWTLPPKIGGGASMAKLVAATLTATISPL